MGFRLKFKSNEDRNMILNYANGIFQIVAVNLVSGFAGLFIKRLGASDSLVSMYNSLPAFFSVAAILLGTSYIMSRKNKKRTTAGLFFATRSFYLFMALVPYLGDGYRAAAAVFILGIMNFPGSMANFAWQSFFADIFRPSIRARALAVRNSLSTVIGTFTILITGFLLSRLSSSKEQLIHYYQIFFAIAFLIGMLEVLSLLAHREDPDNNYKEVVTVDSKISISFLKTMIKQKEYMFLMICVIIFHFVWQMGWPLFLTYEVDYLHTNEMWSGIVSTINGIFTAIGYIYWRKFSEKRGNALALAISGIGVALTPILYVFVSSMQQVSYFIWAIGFVGSGFLLIVINTLYEIAPRENRTSYIAFYNLATNITLIIAPWVGMKLYQFIGIKPAFLIIGFLRIVSSILFLAKPNLLKKAART